MKLPSTGERDEGMHVPPSYRANAKADSGHDQGRVKFGYCGSTKPKQVAKLLFLYKKPKRWTNAQMSRMHPVYRAQMALMQCSTTLGTIICQH